MKLLDRWVVRAKRLAQRQVERVRRPHAETRSVYLLVSNLQSDDRLRFAV
jgi:hypothetical protein